VEAARIAVVDASPCIALARIGQLGLLPALFDEVLVPRAVFLELIVGERSDAAWTIVNHDRVSIVAAPDLEVPVPSSLSQADREVISLALARRPHAVVIDDRAASRFAARAGVRVVGTLGVIAAARRRGLVEAARPLLGRLLALGFHARRDLVDGLLADLGEEPSREDEEY
jgi:predicted nucleic acid-binding protein